MPMALCMFTDKMIITRRRKMRILIQKLYIQTVLSFSSTLTLILIACFIISFSWKVAIAQTGEWIQLEKTNPFPEGRWHYGMVYVPTINSVLFFGGNDERDKIESTGNDFFVDTWEWDGARWNELLGSGPPQGFSPELVFDSKHNQVVLYGGEGPNIGAIKDDTWLWDPETKLWSFIDVPGPPRRVYHMMAYDSTRGQVVLHGGYDFKQEYGDTWIWDGDTNIWTNVSATLPDEYKGPKRSHSELVYDVSRDRVVMYGGIESGIVGDESDDIFKNDLWEWDGTKWEQIPNNSDNWPPALAEFGMAYNSKRQTVVIYGGGGPVNGQEGNGENADYFNDMWEWDGANWIQIQLSDQPKPITAFFKMVYLQHMDSLFLFGGLRNWTYEGDIPVESVEEAWIYQYDYASGIPSNQWLNY